MKYMHIQKCTYLPYWTVNTLIHCGTGITFFVSKFISTNVSVVCNHWTSDANCKDSILKIFPLYDYAGDTASHHLSPFCQVSLKFSLSGLFLHYWISNLISKSGTFRPWNTLFWKGRMHKMVQFFWQFFVGF